MQQYLTNIEAIVNQHIQDHMAFKITLSKPRLNSEFIKTEFSPYQVKEGIKLKQVKYSSTQAYTESIGLVDLVSALESLLRDQFYFLDFTSNVTHSWIKQSNKGQITAQTKQITSGRVKSIGSHNRTKTYEIQPNTPYLIDLGISTKHGNIIGEAQHKFRQINKFIEIISQYTKGIEIKKIVDMGCGKGYLTFAMYDYLQRYQEDKAQVIGYEIRPDLVKKCNEVARKIKYDKLSFEMANIDEANVENTDVLVALHACDIATDMAIAKGIKANAKLMILSPCCHKQIRKQITKKDVITQHGIYLERQAEMITDTIRALLLESKGYHTTIMEFISSEHTAKNTMIIAIKAKVNAEAKNKIEAIKALYGIKNHALEKML